MEEWKDIKGYEGFYQVSNLGDVRNLAVYSYKYAKVIIRKTPRLLRPETTRDGYKRVVLSLFGVKKKYSVHRLVAAAFIPNPNNFPEVNHKDENQANNIAHNLEWCTAKYNSNYGTLPKRIKERMAINHPTAKRVFQYTKDGNFITAYPSLNEAGRNVGVRGDMIGRVCKGKAKSAAGYIFKFAL